MELRVALVTVPDMGCAETLARTLVGERLAACVSILPNVRSIYTWEGKLEDSSELLLLVKTSAGKVGALERRVGELHPYDTPEFVVLTPEAVAERYLGWALASVS